MKKCVDCNKVQPFTNFVPKSSCKDGYEVRCRTCRTIKYNKSTPEKVFKKIYERQVGHSKTRGHSLPSYSYEDLCDWADKQPNLAKIWNDYVNSDYAKNLRPSVDRINDSKPYTLDNIQLMTWAENMQKGANAKKAGTLNANQRPVEAYNLDGSFHKRFVSTIEAARSVQGKPWGIISVANGMPVKDGKGYYYQPKTYKGFGWKWV